MAELQTIPARHGTATFVPAGQVIKIINTSGGQVIDTWAFALPKPEPKKDASPATQGETGEPKKSEVKQAPAKPPPSKTKKKSMDLPSQEDAEKATQQAWKEGDEAAAAEQQQKSSWSSYVPTKYLPSFKKDASKDTKPETEQQKDSKTWASYFPSGKGFTSYIPQTATDTVSGFASMARSLHMKECRCDGVN